MIDNDTVATTARQLRLILDAIERGDLDAKRHRPGTPRRRGYRIGGPDGTALSRKAIGAAIAEWR